MPAKPCEREEKVPDRVRTIWELAVPLLSHCTDGVVISIGAGRLREPAERSFAQVSRRRGVTCDRPVFAFGVRPRTEMTVSLCQGESVALIAAVDK